MPQDALIACIDAGGTTFKVGVADRAGRMLAHARVPTTTPDRTVGQAIEALQRLATEAGGRIVRVGIASFGPIDIDPASAGYGTMLTTPKAGWTGAALLRLFEDGLGVDGALDTDVNGALEAERRWGAAKGTARAAYVTVGTGIGVGVWSDGAFAGAPFHPELGHIRVKRHPDDQDFAGLCPFHGGCLEGLSAGPALAARFGPLEELPADADAWDVPASYLAQLSLTLVLGWRVERVVLGGGVMGAPALLPKVRRALSDLVQGYIDLGPDGADGVVVPPALGDHAGLLGGCAVALRGFGAAPA